MLGIDLGCIIARLGQENNKHLKILNHRFSGATIVCDRA